MLFAQKKKHFNLIIAAILCLLTACKLVPSLGRNPEGDALIHVKQQPNYKNGKFANLPYPDDTAQTRVKRGNMLKWFYGKPDSVVPPRQLPWVKTNLKTLPHDKPVVVWFGHSSVLIKYRGVNLLIDPVFSGNAGPVPGLVKAFKGATHYGVNDMPPIDVVVISHDHYDHLDYRTLKKLRKQVKKVVVPMGVGSHLRYWGFKPEQVVELNWHQWFTFNNNISITATPARHRSNRTFEGNKTLWASYVIKAGNHKLFYSGDGGYGHHFKSIGTQYGPFNLALLECGQYSPNWPHSHMHPSQTAQAAHDLQACTMLPVHWAKFAESNHVWNDPVRQLLPAAQTLGVNVTIPRLGEPYVVDAPAKRKVWWEF